MGRGTGRLSAPGRHRCADTAGRATRSAFGPVLPLGVNVPFNEHWSLVLDVKKIWASTIATATLPAFGGSAASADVRLDPLVSTLALSYRF
ncbi:OmpW family outer membrane protein [Herbaspirillum rubrisubalbicans]|uniref:OmpW family outer membrane protein n=1 Tax=Herbaspirillum rubrisubalbicans TaxID=80842 RepID=UPI00214FD8D4|nr:OmpW family outer membrane protein [Herbaspirillum rubrisubalbicans]